MKTPQERYSSDPAFHALVNTMVNSIVQCKYTPSEMREAALFASIKYEETHIMPKTYPKEIIDWLDGEGG